MSSFSSMFPNKNKEGDELYNSIKTDIDFYGDVSIGTDMEMLWLTQRLSSPKYKFYRADNLFCHSGVCGTDGRSLISELRITPAFDVRVLVDSMHEVLVICHTHKNKRAYECEENYLYETFPYGMNIYSIIKQYQLNLPESIGTHIHFGFIKKNNTYQEIQRVLIQAMDAFVMPIVKCFEPKAGHIIRTMCGYYGDMSEYRVKDYGIEYKSLPCILDNKDVFTGIFAIAKALAFEIVTCNISKNDIAQFTIKKDLLYDMKYLRRIIFRGKLFIKTRCRFYNIYRDEINKLYKLVLSKHPKSIFENEIDIMEAWGISDDDISDYYNEKLSNGMFFPFTEPIEGYKGTFGDIIGNKVANNINYVSIYD